MIQAEVTENAAFNLDFLGVGFPLDLVSGLKLVLAHNTHLFEHPYAGRLEIIVEDKRSRGLAVESPLLSFNLPLVSVAIAVEDNRLDVLDILTDGLEYGSVLVLSGCNQCIDSDLEVSKSLSDSSIESQHSTGAIGLRTYCAELEAISGEGEWRCTVTVGIVNENLRD